MQRLNVLVACEESQAVCKAFRKLGHFAFSCDLQECSGGHPEWHIKGDVLNVLEWEDHGNNVGGIWFYTCNGEFHAIEEWDLIIAHPPCTYLTVTGNRWFNVERYGDKARQRIKDREDAIRFFMSFTKTVCTHVAIENPIGVISTAYRKPDQIIHPYHFGHRERKATCLWLKGLPKLEYTNVVEPVIIKYKNGKGTDNPWHMNTMKLPPDERAKIRSKTFPGIADAMAKQWSEYILRTDYGETR